MRRISNEDWMMCDEERKLARKEKEEWEYITQIVEAWISIIKYSKLKHYEEIRYVCGNWRLIIYRERIISKCPPLCIRYEYADGNYKRRYAVVHGFITSYSSYEKTQWDTGDLESILSGFCENVHRGFYYDSISNWPLTIDDYLYFIKISDDHFPQLLQGLIDTILSQQYTNSAVKNIRKRVLRARKDAPGTKELFDRLYQNMQIAKRLQ